MTKCQQHQERGICIIYIGLYITVTNGLNLVTPLVNNGQANRLISTVEIFVPKSQWWRMDLLKINVIPSCQL